MENAIKEEKNIREQTDQNMLETVQTMINKSKNDLKKEKKGIQTKTCTLLFTEALFTKRWKESKYPSVDEWINKSVCSYSGVLSHKKK